MRDERENELLRIIRRQQEQLELLAQKNEQLETQVVTLEGRVRELNETHKKEIWQLKVNPVFKDINELVKALLEISDQHKQDHKYLLHNILEMLGALREPKHPIQRICWGSTWTDDSSEAQYRDTIDSLCFRIKHLPRSQLNEAVKVIFEAWGNKNRYQRLGWSLMDTPIKTLTSETIQILKEFCKSIY
jgi:hypothetical protein